MQSMLGTNARFLNPPRAKLQDRGQPILHSQRHEG